LADPHTQRSRQEGAEGDVGRLLGAARLLEPLASQWPSYPGNAPTAPCPTSVWLGESRRRVAACSGGRAETLQVRGSLWPPTAVAGPALEHPLQLLDELLHVLYGVPNVLGRHPALVEVLMQRVRRAPESPQLSVLPSYLVHKPPEVAVAS